MHRVLIFIAAALAMLVGSIAPASAQEATPAVGVHEFPITADPFVCQIEPRAAEELLALWYDADGTPVAAQATPEAAQADTNEVTIPVGPPADEATVGAVTETVRELFSCFAAGDILRAYALFTDDLARQFGPPPGTPREEAESFLADPEAEGEGGEILAVASVVTLADGRVGAFVVDRGAEGTNIVYAIFEQQGDRWLIDEVIEFPPHDGEEEEGA
jgi:hypothetical protein